MKFTTSAVTERGDGGEFSNEAIAARAEVYKNLTTEEYADYIAAISVNGDAELARYEDELTVPPYVIMAVRRRDKKAAMAYVNRSGGDRGSRADNWSKSLLRKAKLIA
jgi:hypothetical protein